MEAEWRPGAKTQPPMSSASAAQLQPRRALLTCFMQQGIAGSKGLCRPLGAQNSLGATQMSQVKGLWARIPLSSVSHTRIFSGMWACRQRGGQGSTSDCRLQPEWGSVHLCCGRRWSLEAGPSPPYLRPSALPSLLKPIPQQQ